MPQEKQPIKSDDGDGPNPPSNSSTSAPDSPLPSGIPAMDSLPPEAMPESSPTETVEPSADSLTAGQMPSEGTDGQSADQPLESAVNDSVGLQHEAKAKVRSPPLFSTEFRREAIESELRLNVTKHANALSHVFQTATGEFCFALFGRWGRGKSTLLRCLTNSLTKPDQSEFPTHVSYAIVDFSAWKYRTVPEVWVHLYESFAKVATSGGFFSSKAVALRANVLKHGITPLTWACVLLGIAMIRLDKRFGILVDLIQVLSLGGAIYLLSLFRGAKKSGLIDSVKKYATLSRHNQKLGLQAVIGEDLKALVVGWIPLGHFSQSKLRFFEIAGYVLAGIFALWVMAWRANLLDDIGLHFSFTTETVTWWTCALTWLVVSGWAYLAVYRPEGKQNRGSTKVKRILLCVDDLDRCEPTAMLEIIESLKLLLDEEVYSQRLQVIFLIDRQILDLAILDRYDALLHPDRNTKALGLRASTVIQENHEKCFSASFELLPLQSNDFQSLMDAYTGVIQKDGTPEDSSSKIRAGDEVYSEDDRQALARALSPQDTNSSPIECGPRSLRYVLFQYQLAKLLLREDGVDLPLSRLETIADRLVQNIMRGSRVQGSGDSIVDRVLQQVGRSNIDDNSGEPGV
ncbi:KAP family NTPase [Stieleria sp. ICT_E10.1]|uniref:KAP family NTPase n=1 Tax=Stieleria sedimenti TaxID=2976331 RepID=UPI00217F58E5|nr:KAP family NTPase [Stieleria sedimenti]MCS7469564.1 KAP family NTPase [Stieleria sedimenti]